MSKIDLGHMLVDFEKYGKKWLFANLPKVLIFDLLARRMTINGFLQTDWVPGCHLTLLLV